MPYNPNIKRVWGDVNVDGGGGASDVNVINKPTVNVENTATPIDTHVTNDPLDVSIGNTVDANITNTVTVNVENTVTPVDVNVANASVDVTVSNTVTANIENTLTPVNVAISGTPTVNVGTMPNVTVANNPLNVSVTNTPSVTISGTPNVNAAITNTPTVNIGTMPPVTATTSFSPFVHDGSERLRVGQITTLLDGKILNADNPRLFQNVGTGTGLFATNLYSMSVTSGQYFIRQSRRYCPYFSGKSQLVELTFDNFHPQANVKKRAGYFSSNAVAPHDSNKDSFWLESDGTTIRLIISNNGTETLNAPITSWSGYANLGTYQTLANWQNFTVIAFDFLWLGGAVLRLFVKTSTGFTLAHQFNYSGTTQGQFILSPNQPVRYEIRSTGGSGTFRYVCCQVATEGSYAEAGETLSIANLTNISCNVVNTVYAILGIRKTTTYRDIAVQIIDIAVSNASPQNDAGVLYLLLNPTLSAPLSYVANSRIESAIATTQTVTVSGGAIVCDRVVAALPVGAAGSTSVMSNNFLSYLTNTITNTFDQYVLAYMPITANQSVYGVLTIKEY